MNHFPSEDAIHCIYTAEHAAEGALLNALHRLFSAGVDWRRVLRSLSVIYDDPVHGHARIAGYVQTAMIDKALLAYPPLHADVLIFQLDTSFFGSDTL